MKVFGGIYTGMYGGDGRRCIYYEYMMYSFVLNSWMKANILPFKIYAVLSNFYINSWRKENILPFKIYAVFSKFYLKKNSHFWRMETYVSVQKSGSPNEGGIYRTGNWY